MAEMPTAKIMLNIDCPRCAEVREALGDFIEREVVLCNRIAELEGAINKHRHAIWGIDGKVAHDQDKILYSAIRKKK